MGVTSLLQELKSIIHHKHIKELPKNFKLAIDGHCWLHRGCYSCAKDIVKNIPTTKYIDFFISMLNVLISNGIDSHKIIVVFDGSSLPMKKATHSDRDQTRQHHIEQAEVAESNGDAALAYKHFQQSIFISSMMISNVIVELKKLNIAYLISPYESDAQLTWLSQNHYVDAVVSEDSDLIVYGCRKVFFKLDRMGNYQQMERSDLASNIPLSFLNWTDKQFKYFCCLSGCDYVKNLKNIGIKTAYKIVSKCGPSLSKIASEINRIMSSSGYSNDDIYNYLYQMEMAVATYSYQVIFNPQSLELQYMNMPLPPISDIFTLNYSDSNIMTCCSSSNNNRKMGSVSRLQTMPYIDANNYNSTSTASTSVDTTCYSFSLDFLGVLYDPDLATLHAKGDVSSDLLRHVTDSDGRLIVTIGGGKEVEVSETRSSDWDNVDGDVDQCQTYTSNGYHTQDVNASIFTQPLPIMNTTSYSAAEDEKENQILYSNDTNNNNNNSDSVDSNEELNHNDPHSNYNSNMASFVRHHNKQIMIDSYIGDISASNSNNINEPVNSASPYTNASNKMKGKEDLIDMWSFTDPSLSSSSAAAVQVSNHSNAGNLKSSSHMNITSSSFSMRNKYKRGNSNEGDDGIIGQGTTVSNNNIHNSVRTAGIHTDFSGHSCYVSASATSSYYSEHVSEGFETIQRRKRFR